MRLMEALAFTLIARIIHSRTRAVRVTAPGAMA